MGVFDAIISNYMVFIVIAVVLLLGLFGYMMDRKKYEQYREEIANEERFSRAICYKNGKYIDIDLEEAINMQKTIDKTMYDISKMLV